MVLFFYFFSISLEKVKMNTDPYETDGLDHIRVEFMDNEKGKN